MEDNIITFRLPTVNEMYFKKPVKIFVPTVVKETGGELIAPNLESTKTFPAPTEEIPCINLSSPQLFDSTLNPTYKWSIGEIIAVCISAAVFVGVGIYYYKEYLNNKKSDVSQKSLIGKNQVPNSEIQNDERETKHE